MKRYQKILLGVVVACIVITGGIQLYFTFSLDEQLKETLTSRFHEATNDAYELEIGDFDLGILGRRLSISDISLTQKKTARSTIKASLDELNVTGIGFLNLLLNRRLTLDQIEFVNPEINFTTSKNESDTSTVKSRPSALSKRLSAITLQVLEKVTIPSLLIRGLSVNYQRTDLPVNPYLSLKNSYIQFHDISIDSTSLEDERIIPSDEISMTIRDIQYQTKNELYKLTAEQFIFSSKDQKIDLHSLQLNPRLNREKFTRRVGYEVDHITMGINQISWENLDFEKLNSAEGVFGNRITISKPNIDIYRDTRPPFPPNNNPPLPQQMIQNIPFDINIDTIAISDGNIRYTERQPKADTTGYIEFADLKATFSHLTNIPEQWSDDRPPTLQAETQIMGVAPLKVNFTFPMQTGYQHVEGSLGTMNMKQLNDAMVPLAFVRIEDGRILGMTFDMDLTESQATGTVLLRYEDLKISLLDRESNTETFGKKVTSILANTFKVKSNNTGDDLRTGTVDFERDDQKSVFDYWWKSLLSGLKSSIGV